MLMCIQNIKTCDLLHEILNLLGWSENLVHAYVILVGASF